MLTKFIFILLLVISANLISFGQKDTIIYYGIDEQFNKVITSKESAFSFRKINFNEITKKYNYVEEFINFTDIPPIERGELISISPEIKDGIIINNDNFGNEIHKRFENNKFIRVEKSIDLKGKIIEPIYPSEYLDSLPKINSHTIESKEIENLIYNHIKASIDTSTLTQLHKAHVYLLIEILIDSNGKIVNNKTSKIRGEWLGRTIEINIINSTNQFIQELIFYPGIFEKSKVWSTGKVIIRF